eukprot:PITA_21316
MKVGRRDRGRAIRRVVDEGLREEIRILNAHLTTVEAGRRRDPEVGDDSEEEAVVTTDGSDEGGPEIILLSEDRRVKFAATKMKVHVALWWDSVQAERRRLNKLPIKKWTRMVAKMKGKFLPKYYQIPLHRHVQNLKQKGMTVKECTEEFYRVNLRAGYIEDTLEKTTRFVNHLRLEILDKISILSPKAIKEAYQSTLKAEKKITRKQNARRGRGIGRGKGQSFGRGRTTNNSEEGSSAKTSGTTEGREQAGQRGAYVAQTKEAEASPQEVENVPERGEPLVLNKVLLKQAKETTEQTQRNALFWTVCKSHGKCCKLIIDSGSTDNLVATEMVEKLGLKRLKHPTPYKVSSLQKGHQLLVDE